MSVCEFARAAIAKSQRLGGLTTHTHISPFWSWKSSSKVLAGLVPPETSLVACMYVAFSSLCPPMVLPLCVWVLISSYEDSGHIRLGPAHMTLFYFNHLLKGLLSKHSDILRYWGSGLQYMNLWDLERDTIQPLMPCVSPSNIPKYSSAWHLVIFTIGRRISENKLQLLICDNLSRFLHQILLDKGNYSSKTKIGDTWVA